MTQMPQSKRRKDQQPGAAAVHAARAASVFQPRAYQVDAILNRDQFSAWMWSRQTGKGVMAALKVNNDILEHEARGESIDWLLLNRSLAASRQLGRKVRAVGKVLCEARKLMQPEIETLDDKSFELVYPGGSRVLVMSSNPDAAVGFTGNVLVDEIDVHKQGIELLTNTIPVVSAGPFSCVVTSTPRGRRVMHRIWQDSQQPGSVWSFHKLTIHDAVAQGCPQDPEKLRRAILDDLKWRSEFLCEFVDDDVCWIPWELIVACTSDECCTKPAVCDGETGATYYAGWDLARWNHLSVLWIVAKLGFRLITRGVMVMRSMPFEAQISLVQKTLETFPRVQRLCMDAGGLGEMPFELAKRRMRCSVEGLKFNPQLKETLAGDVRRLMEERNFLLPDDEGVHSDFHALRRTVTGAGNARFEGEADGSHADRFWAGAMAVHAAVNTARPFVMRF